MKSVTTRDVEWDADQQTLILGEAELRRQTCEGCGRPLAESTLKANEFAYDITPIPCHACERVAAARDNYMENNRKHTAPGRWSIQFRKG